MNWGLASLVAEGVSAESTPYISPEPRKKQRLGRSARERKCFEERGFASCVAIGRRVFKVTARHLQ